MAKNTLTPQQQLDRNQARHDWATLLQGWGQQPTVKALGAFSGGAVNAVIDPIRLAAHLGNSLVAWGKLQTAEQAASHAEKIEQQAARPSIFSDAFNDSRQADMQAYPSLAVLGELGLGVAATAPKLVPFFTRTTQPAKAVRRASTAALGFEGAKESYLEAAADAAFNRHVVPVER